MSKIIRFKGLLVQWLIVVLVPSVSLAWGKRGHEIVGSLAAQLLSQEQKSAEFLIHHTFDLGYYNNVPDLIWKADPETYKKESPQHFMDLEDFEKEKNLKWNKDRKAFFKKYSGIELKSGRNYWRVQELSEDLEKITKLLSKKSKNKTAHKNKDKGTTESLAFNAQQITEKKEFHHLQNQWLVTAGVLGHYVADLAQPLHVTNNYDGQLTEQKGIHYWFEGNIIDQLYPEIKHEVYLRAKNKWADFHKKNKNKSPFDLCVELGKNSAQNIPTLLAIDKQTGRASAKDTAMNYKEIAIDRLSTGVLYLAEIWSQQTDWIYDGERFYKFEAAPAYMEPRLEK